MSWIFCNPNPLYNLVEDCTVRAISIAMNQDWHKTYLGIAMKGNDMCNMPSANSVWGAYLLSNGFKRHVIPNTCPSCYTVRNFCYDYPNGIYILATGSHVVTCIDGNYYDTWDSGNEIPIYYWKKEE